MGLTLGCKDGAICIEGVTVTTAVTSCVEVCVTVGATVVYVTISVTNCVHVSIGSDGLEVVI